jgi:hypothetical protein
MDGVRHNSHDAATNESTMSDDVSICGFDRMLCHNTAPNDNGYTDQQRSIRGCIAN